MAAKSMTRIKKTEEPSVEVEKPKTTRTRVKKKREFKDSDGILCRSVTPGGLFMVGKKTGMVYEWNAYGHEYEVEYRDLVIAVRTRSDFVFRPFFIIEDQDFIDEFPLVKKFYEESYKDTDLQKILGLSASEMRDAITALPPKAQESFKNIASTAARDGSLDSIEKIRIIDEIFGINLRVLVG